MCSSVNAATVRPPRAVDDWLTVVHLNTLLYGRFAGASPISETAMQQHLFLGKHAQVP